MTHPIIDISPPISQAIAVWPGDTTFTHTINKSFSQGDAYRLTTINTTVHVGAHADAPSHYHADGKHIGQRDVSLYIGKAQIIACKLAPGARITPDDVSADITEPRVLFQTNSACEPNQFNTDFNSLSGPLIKFLHQKGVVLVGIDTPSIDPFEDTTMHSHQMIAACDMAILEGLYLQNVPEGRYTLIAPPLKLMDCDASPVRALLIPEN